MPPGLGPWVGATFWTGFYPPDSEPFVDFQVVDPNGVPTGDALYSRLGARVLGQAVDDEFGTSISNDGRFVFMSAPRRTARMRDVPELAADRSNSGVVYQMRITSERLEPGGGCTLAEESPPPDLPAFPSCGIFVWVIDQRAQKTDGSRNDKRAERKGYTLYFIKRKV